MGIPCFAACSKSVFPPPVVWTKFTCSFNPMLNGETTPALSANIGKDQGGQEIVNGVDDEGIIIKNVPSLTVLSQPKILT